MKTLEKAVVTDQFPRLKIVRKNGGIALEAWSVVYFNDGNHVAILAPTLDKLARVYLQLTGIALQREKAQHVVITPYLNSDSEAK